MTLFSLFSFLSCNALDIREVNRTRYGAFTIIRSVRTERGESYVPLRGSTSSTASYMVQFDLLFNGKKIKFPGKLVNGKEDRYLWHVYQIGSPQHPVLIAGSEELYILRENGGNLDIEPVPKYDPEESATFQWLDGPGGLPSDLMPVYGPHNDNRINESMEFRGGTQLLINSTLLLDTRTMTSRRIDLDPQKFLSTGWRLLLESTTISKQSVIGYFPEHGALVFRCTSTEAREWPEEEGLAVFFYDRSVFSILKFNRDAMHLKGIDYMDSAWLGTYFEWNSAGQLSAKKNSPKQPWPGKLDLDFKAFSYTLYPARPQSLDHFLAFLKIQFRNSPGFSVQRRTDRTDQERVSYTVSLENESLGLDYYSASWPYQERRSLVFSTYMLDGEEKQKHFRQLLKKLGTDYNREMIERHYADDFFDGSGKQ